MENLSEINRANDVLHRLEARAPGNLEASQLVALAASHVGHARIARGLAQWHAVSGGLAQMQERLSSEHFHVIETAPASFSVRSAVSAIDLCAAAAYRLAGCGRARDRESDVGHLTQRRVTLRPAQTKWLAELCESADWAYLEDARHAVTHRFVLSEVHVGIAPEPVTFLIIGGQPVKPLALSERAVAIATREFHGYCRAVLADYP